MKLPPINLPDSICSLSAIVDDPYRGLDNIADIETIFEIANTVVKDFEVLQMKLDLVSKGVCHIDHDDEDTPLEVNCNDYFYPASDSEVVESDEELRELYLLWNLGPEGDMKWVAHKRGIKCERWRDRR